MRPKRWHLAAVSAAMLVFAATELPARVNESPGTAPAAPTARVAALQHDPQLILERVASRMGITLRPDLPPPAIRLESRTPLERLQAAAERQSRSPPAPGARFPLRLARDPHLIEPLRRIFRNRLQ